MSSTTNEYLTVSEAAELLRVSVSTVRRWIREGGLVAHRVGRRRVLLNRDDVMDSIRVLDNGARSVDNDQPALAGAAHSTLNNLGNDSDDFDLGALASLIEHSPDRPVHRRLAPEEVERRLAALDRAREVSKQIRARQEASGIMTPESWELINEGRDERTRQLMGEDDPEFDAFDIGPVAAMIVHSPDRPVRRPLTPDEQQGMLAALERAKRTSARIQERSGVDVFPPSWPIIAEMRAERTRQLNREDEAPGELGT